MSASDRLAVLRPLIDRCRKGDIWVVESGGSPSHRRGEALTDEHMGAHFDGGPRVGLCPMQRGSSATRLALLDLDSHKGDTPWEEMIAIGRQLVACAGILDVALVPFRSSGGSGLHLFALWDAPQDARSVRELLGGILKGCGLRGGTKGVAAGQVEVFPKQDTVPADGWGNMFVLPGAGKSEPLDPETFEPIAWSDVRFTESHAVPIAEPAPAAPAVYIGAPPELAEVQVALDQLDPDTLGYGGEGGEVGWLEILFATHSATGGSAEGLAMFLAWSSRWSRFDPGASAEHTAVNWRAAKPEGGIGVGTLYRAANEATGWVPPSRRPTVDGFEVLDVGDDGGAAVVRARGRPVSPFEGELPVLMEIVRGKAVVTPGNATNHLRAIQYPAFCGFRLRRDAFTAGEIEIDFGHGGGWESFTDVHYAPIRARLEQLGLESSSKEHVRDSVRAVAKLNEYDSGLDILNGLPAWDGTDRIGTMLPAYFGTADAPYTTAVAHYMMTALVGRILVPGTKADMVPVLVGAQGLGKTAGLMALLHDPAKHYAEIDLAKRDADQARQLRGVIIGELAELRGKGSREMEAIKAFLTREVERWEKKFEESTTTYKRRNIFIGTTNEEEFLVDETGNRRWLPVRVGVGGPVKVGEISAARDQLYAQAVAEFKASGVAWQALVADNFAMLCAEQRDGFETSTPIYELLREQYRFKEGVADGQRIASVLLWAQATGQSAGSATLTALKATKAAVLKLWRESGKARPVGGKLHVFVRSDRPGQSDWRAVYSAGGKNAGLLLPPRTDALPVDRTTGAL